MYTPPDYIYRFGKEMNDSELVQPTFKTYFWYVVQIIFLQSISTAGIAIVVRVYLNDGLPWRDAWQIVIWWVGFVVAATLGNVLVRSHPESPAQGAKILRRTLIVIAIALWFFVKSPLLGWPLLIGLMPSFWATYSYSTFFKESFK